MLISSLREVIQKQAQEIQSLGAQLKAAQAAASDVCIDFVTPSVTNPPLLVQRQSLDDLQSQLSALQVAYDADVEKRKDVEKEQEDLLVLLDELNGKRSRDKQRMREAGLDVSEDEADEDGDEDDEE